MCARLKYEHFKAGQIVFTIGDYGDKFYIILHGSVGVLIPNKKRRKTVDKIIAINKKVPEAVKVV